MSTQFTFQDAEHLARKMHARYGDGFARQWKGFTLKQVAQEFFEELSIMSPEQVARGIEKMRFYEYAPNVAQFSKWCLGDLKSKWLGANEAWNVARGSFDFNGYELTVVWTKETAIAFEAVADLVRLGDKYQIAEAKKVFIERYERLVSEAIEKGLSPEYVISYGEDKEQRKTAIREAEIAGYLAPGSSAPLLETIQSPQDARTEAKQFNAVAMEHLEKIRQILRKPNGAAQEAIQDEGPLSSINDLKDPEEWSDPFDDREKYIAGLKSDGLPVPMTLQNMDRWK